MRARSAATIGRSPPAAAPVARRRAPGGGWLPIVREPYTGAWQQNDEIAPSTRRSPYSAVFACVSLIAADIGEAARCGSSRVDADGIWHETTNPAFSPVLRKPNRYQTIGKFLEQWITSKLALRAIPTS